MTDSSETGGLTVAGVREAEPQPTADTPQPGAIFILPAADPPLLSHLMVSSFGCEHLLGREHFPSNVYKVYCANPDRPVQWRSSSSARLRSLCEYFVLYGVMHGLYSSDDHTQPMPSPKCSIIHSQNYSFCLPDTGLLGVVGRGRCGLLLVYEKCAVCL